MEPSEEEINIVLARLAQIPKTMILNIGGRGPFTRDELISNIRERTEIGELVVKMYMNYIRSFKEEVKNG